MATALLEKPGSRYTLEALQSFRIPDAVRRRIVERWLEEGRPPLRNFVPYTAPVATVDVFFCIAPGADLISRERPSNKIDIAHYSAFPEDVKQRGVMSFAHYPPAEGDFLVSALWDKLMAPGWREAAVKPRKSKSEEAEKRLVAQIRAWSSPRSGCPYWAGSKNLTE